MNEAIREAGISPDDIDYINMHATSTAQGDQSELIAAKTVFGERNSLFVSATKSMTGHLLGAAGAIEAIICVKALQEGVVPPTINTKDIEPEFKDLFQFPLNNAVNHPLKYAMSNTFGFGGHIASVIFKKYTYFLSTEGCFIANQFAIDIAFPYEECRLLGILLRLKKISDHYKIFLSGFVQKFLRVLDRILRI